MRCLASVTPSSAAPSPIAMPSAAMNVTSFMPRKPSIWRKYGVMVSDGVPSALPPRAVSTNTCLPLTRPSGTPSGV
ncbi:hypothetical protein G6F58_013885 [Rhizopus delemar]|nr:hypothetical protein G6F58_013885 [Rhizopus delemar]